jgi:hypothetical protein
MSKEKIEKKIIELEALRENARRNSVRFYAWWDQAKERYELSSLQRQLKAL